ncbi:hypothetical protein LH51_04740 [Nitrincola sp. A-D6]|uniref:hypothetical protein n=1 Tax=Nitrincola sp. A-D6 TaxID=1545442 RepID=UPI00051F9AF6|nr:hypothetical protein [Nitrincola sp. A-D6]KGK42723.1 hypothetical protein LH51_04740 [Nitrincola sp. A-D6]
MYQNRYWNQLKELKVHVFYLQNYAVQQQQYDQWINIFLAVTSSTSIAAWAVWKDYQFAWALIIAASQVITAVKPLLPYRKRMAALNSLGDEISKLSLSSERDWYFVAEGKWTEEEIHKRWSDLKEKSFAAERKCLSGIALPKNRSALEKAQEEADLYLESTYQ